MHYVIYVTAVDTARKKHFHQCKVVSSFYEDTVVIESTTM